MPICNHFHVRQANNGQITSFQGGFPSFMPSFQGNLLTQHYDILSRNTRDSKLSYGKNPKSLSHIGWKWYQVVTDSQTELP